MLIPPKNGQLRTPTSSFAFLLLGTEAFVSPEEALAHYVSGSGFVTHKLNQNGSLLLSSIKKTTPKPTAAIRYRRLFTKNPNWDSTVKRGFK
jgi:hypothetical protein